MGGGLWPKELFQYPYAHINTSKTLVFAKENFDFSPTEAKRLFAAYKHANNFEFDDTLKDEVGMWSVAKGNFNKLHESLLAKNINTTNNILNELFQSNITDGLGGGWSTAQIARKYQVTWISMCADKVQRLMELLALSPVRSIEQKSDFYAPLNIDFEQSIRLILNKLGLKNFKRPNAGKCFGFSVDGTIWSIRDSEHLAAAHNIKMLFGDLTDVSIMEIGGGYGNLAYWLYQLGCRDITIYDLPEVNNLQYYYLSKTIGAENVVLFQEDNFEHNQKGIKILPFWCISNENHRKFSCTISQDSLPEIPHNISNYYLHRVKEFTEQYFVSFNQENQAQSHDTYQIRVPELLDRIDEYSRFIRTPFWLRQGYVQEIYRIHSKTEE